MENNGLKDHSETESSLVKEQFCPEAGGTGDTYPAELQSCYSLAVFSTLLPFKW